MQAVETTIEVDASPHKVWAVLTNFSSYPAWTSFIREITGTLDEGALLRVSLGMEGKRVITVRPRVVAADVDRRFAWSGHVGHPSLFEGIHEFLLTPLPDGRTHLVQRESFRGLIPRIVHSSPRGAIESFSAFNEALKHRVEQQ